MLFRVPYIVVSVAFIRSAFCSVSGVFRRFIITYMYSTLERFRYHPPFTANADDFTAVLLRRDCAAPENLSKQVGEAMLRVLAEQFPDAPVTDDSALRTPLYQVGRSLVPRKWMPAP